MANDRARGFRRNLTNYGDRDFALYLRRSFARSMGYSLEMLERPIIGIAESGSGFNNCHRTIPELVEAVKRGVLAAGGLPLEFPTISLGEIFLSPTSLMFRNLMSMDVEEMVRAQPMDAVVLIGGCDKTVPAQLMGAISANLPAIQLVTGPMLAMPYRGERLGACTDCRRFWARYRAGGVDEAGINEIEGNLATTAGTCAVMGTASTMACIAEALGMALPDSAAIPAVHADRLRMAEASGKRAAAMAQAGSPRPSEIVTPESVENALRVLLAIGGSTNAIIHLVALAGRRGLQLPLRLFDEISGRVPVLANIRPSGEFLMEDFYYAGGLRALLAEIPDCLHLESLTVNGRTLGENMQGARVSNPKVIRPREQALAATGGTAILYGSLAPDGAVIKTSAADPRLLRHTGPAIVFRDYRDMEARIQQEDLAVDEHSVLVLQNAGPLGGPGMPEWGMLPIPQKLLKQGVRDMVRISDARMSGTSYGCCVLHVAPESFVGGPLALVRSGDAIDLDVPARRLTLKVGEEELARRRAAWRRPPPKYQRGFGALFQDNISQANEGCDLRFLEGTAPTPEPEIH